MFVNLRWSLMFTTSVILSSVILYVFILLKLIEEPETDSSILELDAGELLDTKWHKIRTGHWLIGFFDAETNESQNLEENWDFIEMKCKEKNIDVGKVFAPQNPGLCSRFQVSEFPKVFYIENGLAYEIKQPSENRLDELIRDEKWNELKELSNPFSIQMSFLSKLHPANLYNFKSTVNGTFVSYSSDMNSNFGFALILALLFLGLPAACIFGFQVLDFKIRRKANEDQNDKEIEDKDEAKMAEAHEKVKQTIIKLNDIIGHGHMVADAAEKAKQTMKELNEIIAFKDLSELKEKLRILKDQNEELDQKLQHQAADNASLTKQLQVQDKEFALLTESFDSLKEEQVQAMKIMKFTSAQNRKLKVDLKNFQTNFEENKLLEDTLTKKQRRQEERRRKNRSLTRRQKQKLNIFALPEKDEAID